MADLKMIVGLGNPGPRYAKNRHNIGFQCVDLFAQRHRIELSRMQFKARVGDGWVQRKSPEGIFDLFGQGERQKVLLVKPLTYMNNSGQAVAPLVHYYDLEPENVLVIYDDLDLDAGKLRLRPGGGSGGHNGLKSLIQHLGTRDFPRIRVGIGRPPGRMDPAAYVLRDFSAQEEELFGPLRERICDAVECWLFEGIEKAMNEYNG
jgi:PTH1 family peptidyl-tRNA hydrolase